MNGDEALAFPPPSCSFFYGMDLKDEKEDGGGRGCGTWAGHLRHRHASGLLGLMATGATELHPSRRPHPSPFVTAPLPSNPPTSRGLRCGVGAPTRQEREQQHLR